MDKRLMLIAILGIVLIVGIANTDLFSSLVKSPTGLAVADACDSDASCGEGLICVQGKCQKYLCGREALVIEANLDRIINSLTSLKGGEGAGVPSEDISIRDLSFDNELPDPGIGGDVGEGAGNELECRSNRDCNVNSFCDRDNKCKVKLNNNVACSWGSQCKSGTCEEGICVGETCNTEADCGENKFCNDVYKTCYNKAEDGDRCSVNKECKSSGCIGGICARSCNADNECNTIAGELCQARPDGTAKRCLKGIPTECVLENECVLGAVCQDKGNGRKCYSGINGRCIVGMDSLCAFGMICEDKGQGAKCYGYGGYQGCTFEANNEECASELRCSNFVNQKITKCLEAWCDGDNDCKLREQGYVCRKLVGGERKQCLPKAVGGYCDRNEDCIRGSCLSHICQ